MKTFPAKISCLFFLFFHVTQSQAQVSIGARTGISFSGFQAAEHDVLLKVLTGYDAAALLEFSPHKKFAVLHEIAYTRKGFLSVREFFEEKYSYAQSIDYLGTTVLAKYKFGNKKVGGFIQGGLYMGYAISGTYTYLSQSSVSSGKINVDDDDFYRWDSGMLTGIGGYLKAGPGNVFMDFRCLVAFTNPHLLEDDISWGISHSAGYLFPIWNKPD